MNHPLENAAENGPEAQAADGDVMKDLTGGTLIRGDMTAVKGGVALAGWLWTATLPCYVNTLDSRTAMALLSLLALVPLIGIVKAEGLRSKKNYVRKLRSRSGRPAKKPGGPLLLAPALAVAPPVVVGWATHFHLWVCGAALGFSLGLVPLGLLWRRGGKARWSLLALVPAYTAAMAAFCLLCRLAAHMD